MQPITSFQDKFDVCHPHARYSMMHYSIFPILVMLYAALLSGCANNVVNLSYPPLQGSAVPVTERSLTVCVVDFTNKRGTGSIGNRQGGEIILPRTPVERWFASGMAAELRHAGFRVTMMETLEEALASGPDYIVIGEAEDVRLVENSLTRFTGHVRSSITLLDGLGGYVTRNAYSSIYSKAVLPIYGLPQTLLDDALVEMLQPATKLLIQKMQ